MALFSTSNLNKTQDTLAKIDAIITAVEKYPENSCLDLTLNINPFQLLLMILKAFNVTQDELIEWLTKLLKYELPLIELSVKGLILSNLKEMIDCSIDPKIPKWAREDGEGMGFALSTINCNGKLTQNPLSVPKNPLYFGIKNATSPYDFLRPKDFDAFLWLVIHRKFPNSTRVTSISDLANKYGGSIDSSYNSENLFDIIKINYDPYDKSAIGILPGTSFKQITGNNEYNIISVCKSAERNEKNKIISNILYPIGSEYNRLTWYANRKNYFDFFHVNREEDKRDYNKDFGLCDFEFMDSFTSNSGTTKGETIKDCINVKILRKPLIHYPRVGQRIILPVKILFNSKGEPDKDGSFTVKSVSSGTDGGVTAYKILNSNGESAFLMVNEKGEYYVENSSGRLTKTQVLKFLYACYPNNTIYEFNYDYIFSMQLLDAKTVITQMTNALTHLNLGFNININDDISTNTIVGQQRVVEIVKKLVEGNDYESSDCFFTFSNDEVDRMSREAELQRSNAIPFGNNSASVTQDSLSAITSLLNEFEDEPTLSGSTDIFHRLINQVSATIQPETDDTENTSFSFNTTLGSSLIENYIETLTSILVNAILSPKMILMLSINERLCGKYNKSDYTIEALLNRLSGLITSIVKEIRDLILQKLLEFAMEKIKQLLIDLNGKLILEQLMVYRAIIRRLITDCRFGSSALLSTELDNVDYADIDATNNQPKTDKC